MLTRPPDTEKDYIARSGYNEIDRDWSRKSVDFIEIWCFWVTKAEKWQALHEPADRAGQHYSDPAKPEAWLRDETAERADRSVQAGFSKNRIG